MTLERNVNLFKMNNDAWQEAIWLAYRTEAWLFVNFHVISAIFQVNTFFLSSRENGDILANFLAFQEMKDEKKPRRFADSNSATRRIFKRERQKQQIFMRQTTTLHVHHAFFVHFFAVTARLRRENT